MTRSLTLIAVFALTLGFNTYAETGNAPAAVVLKAKGAAALCAPGTAVGPQAKTGDFMVSGASLVTGDDGLAMVKMLDDNSMVRVAQKSILIIKPSKEGGANGPKAKVSLGAALFNITKKIGSNRFEVETPTSVATVKGTRFWIVVKPDGSSSVIVFEGLLEYMNTATGAKQDVHAGETGKATANGLTVSKTDPNDIPKDSDDHKLKFKFKDENNETRDLDIDFGDMQ